MSYFLICSVIFSVVTCTLVYISFNNSLDNAFVFDDHLAITNNHDVKDPSGHNLWTDDIWGKELSAHDSHKSFRPLLIWLFRTLWFISSEARWFRYISLAAHCVATWLFFHLSHMIWARLDISVAAAVMFAVHPIHVESVAAVVNMAEAFSASFIILSYMLFLRSTKRADNSSESNIYYWVCELGCVLLWVVLVVLAALFKETGIAAALLVVAKTGMDVVIWFLSSRIRIKSPIKRTVVPSSGRIVQVYALYAFTALFLTYLYLAGRTLMTSPHRAEILSSARSTLYNLLLKPVLERGESYLDSSQLLRKAENPFAQLVGHEKLFSTMYLHFLYMTKLVYPHEQSPEYAFNCIPKVSSTHDIRLHLSLAVYGVLVGVGVVGLWRAVRSDCRVIRVADSTVSADEASAVDDENVTSAVATNDIPINTTPTGALDTVPLSATGSTSTYPISIKIDAPLPASASYRDEVPADALLHSLMLLAVFFLPASGLVFKLGTLLAERLMYTPSIGSCLLVASAVYGVACTLSCAVCKVGCMFVGGPKDGAVSTDKCCTTNPLKAILNTKSLLTQLLFWPAIFAIVYCYTLRTRTYNTVWHDDNTLFLESLQVCPHSAKMNLQVSKVYSQRGDFKSARRHLEAAQRIDPDFCDTGYQDVVITMAVAAEQGQRNSLDVAAEKAVKNLHCIYTNTATITLLNHLWSSQLQSVQSTGNKKAIFQELEKQGEIALKGDVQFLAAQKFVEASSVAFEASMVDKAVVLATKAEKIVVSLEKKLRNSTDDVVELSADVRCRIFTLSGLFRTSQIQSLSTHTPDNKKKNKSDKKTNKSKKIESEKSSKDTAKSVAKLTTRTTSLLHRAVFRDCMEAAAQLPVLGEDSVGHGGVVVEHLPLAINHLVSLWTLQVSGSAQQNPNSESVSAAAAQPSTLDAYAQDLTSVFYIANLLLRRTTSHRGVNSAGNPKVLELCNLLMKLATNAYHSAGAKFLHAGDLPGAVHSFQRGLLVHSAQHTTRVVEFKYGRTAQSPRESGAVPVVVLQDFRNVTLTLETCTSLHWLTETIAGTPDFQRNLPLVTEVQVYISKLVKCLASKMYSSPKLDAKSLRAVLKSLSASSASLAQNEIDVTNAQ